MLPADRERDAGRRVDVAGVVTLSAALLTAIRALSLGRQEGWPAWTWICLAASPIALVAFVATERLGIQFSAMLAHLTSSVTPRHAPDISGVFTTVMQVAGALGIAAFGSAYLSMAGDGDAPHAFAVVTAGLAVVALLAAAMAHRAVRAR